MGCSDSGADINFAWPTARIAVMGAERRAAPLAAEPEAARDGVSGDARLSSYNDNVATPWIGRRARIHRRGDRTVPDPARDPPALQLLRDKHSAAASRSTT